MRHIQPLLLPQPCQSQAHRGNDRTVPNPCFLSPQTMHIHVRILNLFPQSTTVVSTVSIHSLSSRQEDAHSSSCRRSNYEWIRSGLLKSKDHACRLVYHRAQLDKARPPGTTCHPESPYAGLKSN